LLFHVRYEDAWDTTPKDATALALLNDPSAAKGSPGTHYTADTVKLYDPTGLRSAMTATHAEMYKSIAVRRQLVVPACARTSVVAADARLAPVRSIMAQLDAPGWKRPESSLTPPPSFLSLTLQLRRSSLSPFPFPLSAS
jgi:hypothetical protein